MNNWPVYLLFWSVAFMAIGTFIIRGGDGPDSFA